MLNTRNILCILGICFLYGCASIKNSFYSYQLNMYSLEDKKILLSPEFLISYKNYLFEFKKLVRQDDEYHGSTGIVNSTVTYETIGVYLLSILKPTFFEFDTFSLKNNLKKVGSWEEKEFGTKLSMPVAKTDKDYTYGLPVDTVTNNIECYYIPIIHNSNLRDTIDRKLIAIKNKQLNSLYKIQGFGVEDKDFCVIGTWVFDRKNQNGFSQEIEKLRPLTKKEKSICESMIKKVEKYLNSK